MTSPISTSQQLAERLRQLAAEVEANEPAEFTWHAVNGRTHEVGRWAPRVDITITWAQP